MSGDEPVGPSGESRVSVTITSAAREFLAQAPTEVQRFPVALAEALGAEPDVLGLTVDFLTTLRDMDVPILRLTAETNRKPVCLWNLRADDLLSPEGFHFDFAIAELPRLYRLHARRNGWPGYTGPLPIPTSVERDTPMPKQRNKRPPSVADFVDDRPPDVQAVEYQQVLQQGWHKAAELQQQRQEDASKVKMAEFIIDHHQAGTQPEAPAQPNAAARVTWSGWTWKDGDMMPPSNRRAFFEEDPIVDPIVSKEMEDIKRLEQALKAAGTDPQARDELLGRMVGQNILHWMTVQSLLASSDSQASAQQEAPAPRERKHRRKSSDTMLTTWDAADYLGISESAMQKPHMKREIGCEYRGSAVVWPKENLDAYRKKNGGNP